MEKVGIKAVSNVVAILCQAVALGDSVLEDGKIGLSDFDKIPAFFNCALAVKSVDYSAVLPELEDLDEAEIAELEILFDKHFDLIADGVESKVEQGLRLLVGLIKAVLAVKDALKK